MVSLESAVDCPVDRPKTQFEFLLNLADGCALRVHSPDGFTVEHQTRPAAKLHALLLRSCHACADSLTDQIVLKLREHTNHSE